MEIAMEKTCLWDSGLRNIFVTLNIVINYYLTRRILWSICVVRPESIQAFLNICRIDGAAWLLHDNQPVAILPGICDLWSLHIVCPESIQHIWIYWQSVTQPWSCLATNQWACVNRHGTVGLLSRRLLSEARKTEIEVVYWVALSSITFMLVWTRLNDIRLEFGNGVNLGWGGYTAFFFFVFLKKLISINDISDHQICQFP